MTSSKSLRQPASLRRAAAPTWHWQSSRCGCCRWVGRGSGGGQVAAVPWTFCGWVEEAGSTSCPLMPRARPSDRLVSPPLVPLQAQLAQLQSQVAPGEADAAREVALLRCQLDTVQQELLQQTQLSQSLMQQLGEAEQVSAHKLSPMCFCVPCSLHASEVTLGKQVHAPPPPFFFRLRMDQPRGRHVKLQRSPTPCLLQQQRTRIQAEMRLSQVCDRVDRRLQCHTSTACPP